MASEVYAMTLQELFGVELPIIQAPMAGYQGSEMAIAVSNAVGFAALRQLKSAGDAD
jgi:NAD(P)H-dependent flavin oxidoreductase YrpB (nitropropane dioxygenase family)